MKIVVTKGCKEWERGTFTIVFDTEEERKALLNSMRDGTSLKVTREEREEDKMKQTIIDGIKVIVERCYDCPFYDEVSDGWRNICRYPHKPAVLDDCQYANPEDIPEDCPLANVVPEEGRK